MSKKRKVSLYPRNKRGLSDIVTNLVLIILVLVAVGVVWVVVRNVVSQGAGEISLGRFTFNLEIKSAYVDGTNIRVIVERSPGGGTLLGVNFIFSNGLENIIIERRVSIDELEQKSFIFSETQIPGIGAGDEVSVVPVYESSFGEELGGITDTATISGGLGGDDGDGDGDNGDGGDGDGQGDPGTGSCGDGLIQTPNEDGFNEQCDGDNLNGQSCSSLLLGTGNLSCSPICLFDTTQCSETPASSCDGVWDQEDIDDGNECDGDPLPDNCLASCMCEDGFSPDGSGGCILDPALTTGVIFTVWNNIFFDSHDLPKDETVSVYQAKYINFSNSPETRCFHITFVDYLEPNDISYMRLDDNLFTPTISAGEGYSIWEAANCGQ
jgi:hypothetical protein